MMIKMDRRTISVKNEQGAIAIFLATILALLLLVTTTYAARITISEIQQSSQVDRSEKAYYAAEAGIEDAIYKLQNKTEEQKLEDLFPAMFTPNANGDMAIMVDNTGAWSPTTILSAVRNDDSSDGNWQLAWRNRIVSTGSSESSIGTQPKDVTKEFDASNLTRAGSASVDYNDFAGIQYCWRDAATLPASIEMTIISWDAGSNSGSNVDSSTIKTEKLAFGLNYSVGQQQLNGSHTNASPTACQDNAYSNAINFNIPLSYTDDLGTTYLPRNRRYIFRIKPFYDQSQANLADQSSYRVDYRVFLKDEGVGNPLRINEGGYTIDVVGQSGEIRRRLVARLSADAGLIGVFDYLLYSGGGDLCKLGIEQRNDVNDYVNYYCSPLPSVQIPPGINNY